MEYKNPWEFDSRLTEDKLITVCSCIEQLCNTSSNFVLDKFGVNHFVRGTTCFGVVHAKLNEWHINKDYDWFRVLDTKAGGELEISGVKCKFYSVDDITRLPAKVYKLGKNEIFSSCNLDLFFDCEELDCSNQVVIWRILIQKPTSSNELDEYKVYFVGFNLQTQQTVSQWHLDKKINNNFDKLISTDDVAQQDFDMSAKVAKKPDEKSSNS